MAKVFWIFAVSLVLNASAAHAELSPDLSFYGGDARLTSLVTGQVSTEKVLMARTVDPAAGRIVEIACIKESGKPAQLSPAYISISGNTVTSMSSTEDGEQSAFSGAGTLSGQPWQWNYLKFIMTFPLPPAHGYLRIEDANFITPTQFIARKQLFFISSYDSTQTATPVQLWDAELVSMTSEQYSAAYSEMGCPTP